MAVFVEYKLVPPRKPFAPGPFGGLCFLALIMIGDNYVLVLVLVEWEVSTKHGKRVIDL